MMLGIPQIVSPSEEWLAFTWSQQVFTLVFLVACVLAMRKIEDRIPADTAFFAGLMLSATAMLYLLAFSFGYFANWVSVLLGALEGLACAVFFLLWQIVYASEGQNRSAIYLPLSSLMVVVVCLMLRLLPVPAAAFAIVVVLPLAATYTLRRSLARVDSFPARDARPYARVVIGDIWKPVLCASIVCFAWALSSHIPALYDHAAVTSALVGFGAASLLIASVELFTSKGFKILDVYQAIFPMLGIVLCLPVFFGGEWENLLTGALAFGSHLVKLLIFIMAATYASRTQFSPVAIYGFCVIPLLAALVIGDTLGFALVNGALATDERIVRISAICLLALFIGVGLASLGRRFKGSAEPVDDTLVINSALYAAFDENRNSQRVRAKQEVLPDSVVQAEEIDALADTELGRGLSARELEVVAMLLKGNSVAAISRKLFISENTTRGHTKRIYRKLDVHSRQELIDLFEGEDAQGRQR
ncbi:helix-turn-helix transcriptional regulator [Raoultibacter phocaeensis]|uniref:helix-turn-helix transcriptional regulator n=1 Tax=Raoultibacter phocaeensis TaxID=2479841 RepID=UPI002104DCD8|nr:helix-turn-helix transcriptional regulator [Raoultibacter phocaeensis]